MSWTCLHGHDRVNEKGLLPHPVHFNVMEKRPGFLPKGHNSTKPLKWLVSFRFEGAESSAFKIYWNVLDSSPLLAQNDDLKI